MSQHYTRNTISVSKWCNACKGFTLHRVTSRRANDCEQCMEKLEQQHRQRLAQRPPAEEQRELFA